MSIETRLSPSENVRELMERQNIMGLHYAPDEGLLHDLLSAGCGSRQGDAESKGYRIGASVARARKEEAGGRSEAVAGVENKALVDMVGVRVDSSSCVRAECSIRCLERACVPRKGEGRVQG